MKVGASKVPKWESALWSYVSSGDGELCPLGSYCHTKQRDGWCLDDNKEYLNRVVDYKRFKILDYNFIDYNLIKHAPSCRIFTKLEMLAQRWLEKGKVHCPPVPTELIWLADEERPIEVRQLLLKAYHGAIWQVDGRWIVYLKESDTIARRRLTLFHEIFHILAHNNKTSPVFKKRGITQGSFNEMLADCFAVYILMPREWVKEKWADVKDLDKMVKIFDVPKPAMCVRLKRLGLI